TYLRCRGEVLRLPLRALLWIAGGGVAMFVFGNGLITVVLDRVPSGMASVLVASTPLWMALLEMLWPGGGRLSLRGWLGLAVGLGGVLLLLAPQLGDPAGLFQEIQGPLLVLGSTWSWALGSLIVRYRQRTGSHLAAAAYQMALGGGGLALVGLA